MIPANTASTAHSRPTLTPRAPSPSRSPVSTLLRDTPSSGPSGPDPVAATPPATRTPADHARRGEPPVRHPRQSCAALPALECDPLPFPRGNAPWQTWCDALTPPAGPVGFGAVETIGGWFVRCPACQRSWCRLAPSGTDLRAYFLHARGGCGRGCRPRNIAYFYHAFVLFEEPLAVPDPALARKARNEVKRVLGELVVEPPGVRAAAAALAAAAREVGFAGAVGELKECVSLDGLLEAGARLGLPPATVDQVAHDGYAQGWNRAWGLG